MRIKNLIYNMNVESCQGTTMKKENYDDFHNSTNEEKLHVVSEDFKFYLETKTRGLEE